MPSTLRCTLAAAFTLLLPLPAFADDDAAADAEVWPDYSSRPRTVEVASNPQGGFPPPPPRGTPRRVSLSASVGPGWLALRDSLGREGQQAMSFALRGGAVMGPQWNFVLGVERASTERGGATFAQTAGMMGVQRFLFDRLYLGGTLGLAWVAETGVPDGLVDGPGGAASAHLGVELFRTRHAAVTLETSFMLGQYAKEMWEMGGFRVGVIVF